LGFGRCDRRARLMSLQLSIAHASAIGPRAENQDALRVVTPAAELAASKGYLCAMADGVSQCADGGLAARSTLQANGGGQPLLTTLSALVFRGQRFTLAHVGDCRAYRWLDGELQRISEDHVWEQPGMQHVLKRALGLDQHLVLDFLDGQLREGECFLLLSDGVWATLADHSISAILREQTDLDLAVSTLINAAHLAGSQDNASALLVRVDTVGEATLGDALVQLQQWPLPPPLKAGQHFEGWQVDAVLAHSRQSLLYRVRDAQQQPWLLKTLPLSRDNDSDGGQALLSEEWFLRRVAGRAFPEVHTASGRQHLYYVMREYPGMTLAELFQRQGPLPLAQWQSVAERLLRAVGMLHRRQILHRDIKPENLLLGDDGELRVLDFGLAYCSGLSEDRAHVLPGTPSFIAPEAFNGDRPTAQQDLYSVGVTLYFLLTGHYPYGEIEAFQRPRFAQSVTASRYRPDLPDWLPLSLERAVAAQPTHRYETAEEWLLVLEQADRQELSIRPRPLLEREPLKVWRTLGLVSMLINLILLYSLFHS
jgi:serine/threonine protein phosphatase PrpC